MTTQYEIDLALMAGYAYQTTRKTVNQFPAPPGWTVFYHATDATFGSTSGFEAVSFKRGSEIVISFAGT